MDINTFQRKLLYWYKKNQRELPWRNTQNPYYIWLSEIILQQTQIKQGLDYYQRFVSRFPEISQLSEAEEDEVLHYWQGLGYYRRALNLHAAAKTIVEQFDGKFPEAYNDILKLKGVGEYTAAAISSFAFNKPYAVVDGNVFRFLSRLYNFDVPINSTNGAKLFKQLAGELLNTKQPGLHNQAMIEFGALQCKPANPLCEKCPFNDICEALASGTVDKRPVKEPKTKIKDRYFYYLFFRNGDTTYIQKRVDNDIWKGLYEFPFLETPKEFPVEALIETGQFQKFVSKNMSIKSVSVIQKHVLTHQHIFAQFIEIEGSPSEPDNYVKCRIDELGHYPFPRLIDKYLNHIL